MLFKLYRIYVFISPYFFVLLIWAIFSNKIYTFFLCFSALVLHETGHITIAYFLKEKISIFRIIPFGFSCRLKNQTKVPKKNMIKILIAGPAASIIAAGLFFFWTNNFAMINLFMGLFNLIPIGELDGNRLLKMLI